MNTELRFQHPREGCTGIAGWLLSQYSGVRYRDHEDNCLVGPHGIGELLIQQISFSNKHRRMDEDSVNFGSPHGCTHMCPQICQHTTHIHATHNILKHAHIQQTYHTHIQHATHHTHIHITCNISHTWAHVTHNIPHTHKHTHHIIHIEAKNPTIYHILV